MKCLVVLALVALAVAEPPVKENTASETSKDKRGAVSYGTTADYSGAVLGSGIGHQAAIGISASPLAYSALGGASPLLLSGAGLGYSGLAHGLSGYSGLSHGIAGYSGLSHGIAAAPVGLAGIGYGVNPLLLQSGLGGLGGIHGLGLGYSGLSLASPAALKVASYPSQSYDVSYLSAPKSTYSVPSTSTYSTSFQPITSSYSSPSTSYGLPSTSYSSPSHSSYSSSSYSVPSSSYGTPSSSYSVPSSSYSAPSSSYGAPSSDSYNTVSYSGSREYRSNHS